MMNLRKDIQKITNEEMLLNIINRKKTSVIKTKQRIDEEKRLKVEFIQQLKLILDPITKKVGIPIYFLINDKSTDISCTIDLTHKKTKHKTHTVRIILTKGSIFPALNDKNSLKIFIKDIEKDIRYLIRFIRQKIVITKPQAIVGLNIYDKDII
jgi:hypothetical protein